jgi:hypothetical protein
MNNVNLQFNQTKKDPTYLSSNVVNLFIVAHGQFQH